MTVTAGAHTASRNAGWLCPRCPRCCPSLHAAAICFPAMTRLASSPTHQFSRPLSARGHSQLHCEGGGSGLRWCCRECETDVNPACYPTAVAEQALGARTGKKSDGNKRSGRATPANAFALLMTDSGSDEEGEEEGRGGGGGGGGGVLHQWISDHKNRLEPTST
eukprot:SAG11_NODE_39_length_21630_cov_11.188658_19_plen_164_part_00